MFESLLVDPPVWILWGLGCLSVHILSYLLSSHVLPKGPWTELPSFTAHQVVALPVMIYTTILGFQSWFGTLLEAECSNNMVLDIYPQGLYFGQLVIGGMLLWDIPTGFLSDGMGDPILHVHHIGMLLVAGITVGVFSSQPIGSCYAPFFFGVIEVSSIPLAIVDIFHPKRKAWHDYHTSIHTLVTINDISRILFAILFILVRAIYFPYVVLTQVLPDFWNQANNKTIKQDSDMTARDAPALWAIMILSLLFSILQLYWGTMVVQQIVKVLNIGPTVLSKEEKKQH